MESENQKKYDKPLIVYKNGSIEALEAGKEICKYLIESNYVKNIYVEDLNLLNSETIFENKEKEKYFKKFDIKNEDSNICIIIGGDGTCLWANKLYEDKPRPPFFPFYKGTLGFLCIYQTELYKETLDYFYKDKKYEFMKRTLIEGNVFEDEEEKKYTENKKYFTKTRKVKKIFSHKALNDITIERGKTMAYLDVFLEEDFLAQVSSDGLIFSTPTGSTAYSLSAGGPILHNSVVGLTITAICPFTLSFRPIVLPPNIKVRIRNATKNNMPKIYFDGNGGSVLESNQYLEMSLSDSSIDFIILTSKKNELNLLWIGKISKNLGWNHPFQ